MVKKLMLREEVRSRKGKAFMVEDLNPVFPGKKPIFFQPQDIFWGNNAPVAGNRRRGTWGWSGYYSGFLTLEESF